MALCTVSGTFVDPQGFAIVGSTVRFNTESPILDSSGNLLLPKEITTTTASDGSWSLDLSQNIAGQLTFDLNPTTTAPSIKYTFSLLIPSTGFATFASCWVESPNYSGGSSTTPNALSFSDIAGQISPSQLAPLPTGQIYVGDTNDLAQTVDVSGDATLDDTGALTVVTVGGSTAANIHTSDLLARSATSSNTASQIVKRDSSGNFVASTITANLVGNVTGNADTATLATTATTAINATNFTASLVGDVTGSQSSTLLSKIAGTVISGTTGTGSVVLGTAPTLSNPVVGTQTQGNSSTRAASTAYVDTAVANAVAGVNPAVAVKAATTQASDTSSFTYNNGVSGVGATLTGSVNTAFTVDGVTFTAVGQRVLIKNDTQSPSGAFNGVYSVTQIQTALLAPILTRALDYNTPSAINNTGAIPVISGTANSTTSWVQTAQITTIGTDSLSFVEFTRNPADYLLVANNLSDVGTKATAFNNVSPITSTGDLIIGNGTNSNTRLAKGTQYQTLQTGATTLGYDALHLDQAAAVTGVLPNTSTTAASANTASAIVARDGSGNFIAGTITASLTGAASLNLLKASNLSDVANSATSFTNIAPAVGSSGNVLTSNGSSWSSQPVGSGGVTAAIVNINAFLAFS